MRTRATLPAGTTTTLGRIVGCCLVTVVSALAGCQRSAEAIAEPSALAGLSRRDCFVPDIPRPARCIEMRVPVDWGRPSAESITVAAVVVPAARQSEKEPVFVIPGGPGQGASGYGALVTTAFAPMQQTRDLVLIDPRGTGHSTPFDCLPDTLASPFPDADERTAFGRSCAARAPAPAEFFTSREIVADIEALRLALGYQRIAVWAGSFGTRVAQFYVRAHGNAVSALILDAAVPAEVPFVLSASVLAEQAYARLLDRCERDVACAPRLGEPLRAFKAWIAAHDAARRYVVVDPRSQAPVSYEMRREDLLEIVRGVLYVPAYAAMLPLAIRELQSGNASPLMALRAETAGWSTSTQQIGALLGVMCSEEVPRVRAAQLRSRRAGVLFDDAYARVFLDLCGDWPVRALPDEMWQLPETDVPLLVLSGEDDPASPPRQGELVRRHFTSAQHVIVPHGGHISSRAACMPSLMAKFLDAPTARVDGSCVAHRTAPPFQLSAMGPVTNDD